MQGKHQETEQNCISPSSWINHFTNLSEIKMSFHNRVEDIANKLKELEQHSCFNELDFPISDTEIIDAISQLKLNKSPGPGWNFK